MNLYSKLFLFLAFVFFTKQLSAQCGVTDTIISIADDEKPMEFQLIVDGFSNNDLSDPNQGVCGVTLKYNHKKRSELTIDLVSPSGQIVRLVGPFVADNNTLFGTILWDVSFVRCSSLASPDDANKDQHFNSTNDWFPKPNGYSGVYYPNDYCLESFNIGPVNGTWTFVVHDHSHFYKGNLLGFTIDFCDGSSINCDMCEANAGIFTTTAYDYCEDNENVKVELNHSFNNNEPNSSSYGFEYVVAKDNNIIEHSVSPNLDFREVGEYKICGVSYHKVDSSNIVNLMDSLTLDILYDSIELIGSPYCADITDTCITVLVNPVDTIRIDTTICLGDTIVFKNKKLYTKGEYYFESNENCDSSFLLNLNLIVLNSGIDAPRTTINCDDDLFIKGLGYDSMSGMTFKWDTFLVADANDRTKVFIGKEGTYSFILTQGACSDTASVTIDADNDVPIIDFTIPEINCENDTVLVSVSSSNTTLDSVVWYNGDTYFGTTISISVAGGYFVQAFSTDGCKSFEIIEIPIDTIKPSANITATDITCDIDTAFIKFESADVLQEIYWIELNKYGEEVFALDSGMYHVRFTGENGCESFDSIFVHSYKDDIDFSIVSDTLTCFVTSTTIDFTSTEDSLSILWITPNGDTLDTEDIKVDTPGIYKYFITNKYACVTKGQYEVVESADRPVINFAKDTFFISCGTPAVLNSSISGSYTTLAWGGPGDFYSSDKNPIVDLEGTYYIYITGRNGCFSRDSVEVRYDKTVPDIEIMTDTITCLDSIPFLNVKYSGNYSFKWEDPFQLTYFGSSLHGLRYTGGFYYLTVTDLDKGCDSKFYTYVPVDTIKPTFDFVYSNLLDCTNDSLVLKYNTDYDVELFHWIGNSIDSKLDSIIVWNEGFVKGKLTSSSGCYYEDSTYIRREDHIGINDSTFYLNCYNNLEATLGINDPRPEYDYKWIGNGFTSSNPNPKVDKEGAYKVIVSSADCLDSAEMLVLIDTMKPEFSLKYDSIITCDQGFVTFEVEIQGLITEYFWLGSNNYYSEINIDTIYTDGEYRCYVRGLNGCQIIDTINVTKSEEYPEVTAYGDSINCNSPTGDLKISADIEGEYTDVFWEGPNGYKSYNIDNIVSEAGKYTISASSKDGCVDQDSAFIVIDLEKPTIEYDTIPKITCYQDTVVINSSITPDVSEIKWIGPFGFESEDSTIRVTNGGDYIVDLVGQNGCSSSDTLNIQIDKLKPMLIIDAENLNCCASKKTITLNATADRYSQTWTYPDSSQSFEKDIKVAEEGYYSVEVLDLDNGCVSVDSVYVSWDSISPKIYVEDYFLNCDTSKIEMVAYSDLPDVEFKWYGPGFFTEGNKVYTNKKGKYYIVAIGKNCCTYTKEFNVIERKISPEFDVYGGNLDCKNDSVKLYAVGVEDDLSLEWTGPNGFASNEKNPIVYEGGKYDIRVIGQNMCDSVASVTVDIDTISPKFTLEYSDSLFCNKKQGEVTAVISNKEDVLYSYNWSTEKGIISFGKYSDKMTFKGGGTYILDIINNANGCSSVDSILVTSYDYKLDSATINITPPSCFGYSDAVIEIDSVYGGKKPFLYSLDNYWYSNNKSYNSKEAGVYNIYIKDLYGCVLDTNIVIPDGADVQLQLGVDKNNIFQGDSVTVTAIIVAKNGIESYNWKPEFLFGNQPDSVQVIKPKKSNNIILTVVDSNGCSAEDVIWINVKGNPDIYVPNIFTPNGDGLNDYFYMKVGAGVKNINRLMIFDNWGDKLFDKRNLRKNVPIDGWNGEFRGKKVGLGVFVYVFELELEDGSIRRIAGDVTIVK